MAVTAKSEMYIYIYPALQKGTELIFRNENTRTFSNRNLKLLPTNTKKV